MSLILKMMFSRGFFGVEFVKLDFGFAEAENVQYFVGKAEKMVVY
jgi:hypothetical protein